MAWEGYTDGTQGVKRGWAEEGNINLLIFGTDPTTVRFLMEAITVEDVMASQKVTKEEALDFLVTKYAREHWIMPISFWEHTIPSVPGKRLFSVQTCMGMNICPLCAANGELRAKGVTENKLLPYPVRKRYVMPAWSYEHKMVLYVKQAEDFFNEVKIYLEKAMKDPASHGKGVLFDVYRTGTGFNTKYKVVYSGVTDEPLPVEMQSLVKPCDIQWKKYDPGKGDVSFPPKDDFKDDIPGESLPPRGKEAAPAGSPAGEFTLPFGSHKGLTLRQLFDMGEQAYIEFLVTHASGIAQAKAKEFLATVKK